MDAPASAGVEKGVNVSLDLPERAGHGSAAGVPAGEERRRQPVGHLDAEDASYRWVCMRVNLGCGHNKKLMVDEDAEENQHNQPNLKKKPKRADFYGGFPKAQNNRKHTYTQQGSCGAYNRPLRPVADAASQEAAEFAADSQG